MTLLLLLLLLLRVRRGEALVVVVVVAVAAAVVGRPSGGGGGGRGEVVVVAVAVGGGGGGSARVDGRHDLELGAKLRENDGGSTVAMNKKLSCLLVLYSTTHLHLGTSKLLMLRHRGRHRAGRQLGAVGVGAVAVWDVAGVGRGGGRVAVGEAVVEEGVAMVVVVVRGGGGGGGGGSEVGGGGGGGRCGGSGRHAHHHALRRGQRLLHVTSGTCGRRIQAHLPVKATWLFLFSGWYRISTVSHTISKTYQDSTLLLRRRRSVDTRWAATPAQRSRGRRRRFRWEDRCSAEETPCLRSALPLRARPSGENRASGATRQRAGRAAWPGGTGDRCSPLARLRDRPRPSGPGAAEVPAAAAAAAAGGRRCRCRRRRRVRQAEPPCRPQRPLCKWRFNGCLKRFCKSQVFILFFIP